MVPKRSGHKLAPKMPAATCAQVSRPHDCIQIFKSPRLVASFVASILFAPVLYSFPPVSKAEIETPKNQDRVIDESFHFNATRAIEPQEKPADLWADLGSWSLEASARHVLPRLLQHLFHKLAPLALQV